MHNLKAGKRTLNQYLVGPLRLLSQSHVLIKGGEIVTKQGKVRGSPSLICEPGQGKLSLIPIAVSIHRRTDGSNGRGAEMTWHRDCWHAVSVTGVRLFGFAFHSGF